jgi:leucyl/phenylalanyl-tRNA--protein transferase
MSELQLDMLGPEADAPFPPADHALRRPNGLLAWGGGLEPERLLRAYRRGIFPWYSADEPILWWTPDPRCVLFPERVYVSGRTRRRFNSGCYRVTADCAFADVIDGCAEPRDGVAGTWITDELKASFVQLHARGICHSVEVWQEEQLVGGIYGMALGQAFFGESMFSRTVDTSKIALIALCRQLQQWSFKLLDCQVTNPHLLSMGAMEIPRNEFLALVDQLAVQPAQLGNWKERFTVADRW